MSRCFPFPPPGYEKKVGSDDVDLLKKEKEKERKHKKERKDKEKRESKEKKEKDRSDKKHRDKKEKKEKNRDRKKEKDRDKDISGNSDGKHPPGNHEGQNGDKTFDEKKVSGKSEAQSGEKVIHKEKERDKDRSRISGEKKVMGALQNYKVEKPNQNNHVLDASRDSMFVQELGRRIRDEDGGAGIQLAGKRMGTDQQREVGTVRLVAKTPSALAEGEEKSKKSHDRKSDRQGIRDGARISGNVFAQNFAGSATSRVEGMARQTENEKVVEGKMKQRERESGNKVGDKLKDKDRGKKGHGKDRDLDKEKKEEKAKTKFPPRNLEQYNLKESSKDDIVDATSLKQPHSFKESNSNLLTEENLRKRKDIEKNGFLHVLDAKPSKLPRPTSSHPFVDNGRTGESCHIQASLASDRQGSVTSLKVENKEGKLNGVIDDQVYSATLAKPSSAVAQSVEIDEVSVKPPHPDSKYLSQVLSVPKMEEWSDYDDQQWLFGSSENQSKKPKVGSYEIHEIPQVWAEAVRIESADVNALPYVIPY